MLIYAKKTLTSLHKKKKSTIYNNEHRRWDFLFGKIPGFYGTNFALSVPKIVRSVWILTTEEFGGKSVRFKNTETCYSINCYFRKSCQTFWYKILQSEYLHQQDSTD
jgi:hypothetical protein